jgi:hypothetical protein
MHRDRDGHSSATRYGLNDVTLILSAIERAFGVAWIDEFAEDLNGDICGLALSLVLNAAVIHEVCVCSAGRIRALLPDGIRLKGAAISGYSHFPCDTIR